MITPHHDCDSTEYVPSRAAYVDHMRRGEPACEYALASTSYYHHVRKGTPGEWPGWKRIHAGHDCGSTEYVPSRAAYLYHQRRGEPACEYALASSSYYHHVRKGTPGEWPGRKQLNFDGHDCDSTEYVPSQAAYVYHITRGEPTCDYGRYCASYYRHVLFGLPADAWDKSGGLPDKIPTSVYRIRFSDCSTYYGITSYKDERRALWGYKVNVLLDWKLRHEDHVRETLVICPSRTYARYVEASLIRKHKSPEEGILLNRIHPTPLLPQACEIP